MRVLRSVVVRPAGCSRLRRVAWCLRPATPRLSAARALANLSLPGGQGRGVGFSVADAEELTSDALQVGRRAAGWASGRRKELAGGQAG